MVKVRNTRILFLLLTPIIILFAAGVFLKSTRKVVPQGACTAMDFSGKPTNDTVAIFDGKTVDAPPIALADNINTSVLGVADPDERWVEVDLSEQKLRAWDGDKLFLETLVSTGLPGTPTPTGEFRVWAKLRATRMEGGEGSHYYNLPNVPYVLFFGNSTVSDYLGYSLHGTYWHNDFGSTRSHGCVNLPTPVAEKLYYWASPVLDGGETSTYSSAENPGIRVIIHD